MNMQTEALTMKPRLQILTHPVPVPGKMKTNAGLKAATVQYAKTRPVFEQYKATKYSRKYLAEHEAALELYRAAQAEMRSLLGWAKLPKMDVLKEEGRKLTAKKKQLCSV